MLPLWDTLPTRRTPVVTYALIVLNVLIFLVEVAALQTAPNTLSNYGFVPQRFADHPLHEIDNIVTSMFIHSPEGWWHLGGNMLFLWIFGDNVEDALGRKRFVAFYAIVGTIAAIAQWAVAPYARVPMVGASGAIAGVLAAYTSLYPKAPVKVLNPIPIFWVFGMIVVTLPAWVVIALFFLANLVSATAADANVSGVAFFAHLGGFAAGLLLVRVMLPAAPAADPLARPK